MLCIFFLFVSTQFFPCFIHFLFIVFGCEFEAIRLNYMYIVCVECCWCLVWWYHSSFDIVFCFIYSKWDKLKRQRKWDEKNKLKKINDRCFLVEWGHSIVWLLFFHFKFVILLKILLNSFILFIIFCLLFFLNILRIFFSIIFNFNLIKCAFSIGLLDFFVVSLLLLLLFFFSLFYFIK